MRGPVLRRAVASLRDLFLPSMEYPTSHKEYIDMRIPVPLIAIILLLTASASSAQIVSDATTTSCEGATERLYDTLDAGRPVIIAMLAFDCWTSCNPDAPHVGVFAREQAGRVHVWAPMFNLERKQKVSATCDSMPAWKARHGWTNIHAFIDEPVTWAYEYGAHYAVIDPRTRSVAYRGNDFARAASTALELVDVVADAGDADALPATLDLR